MRRLPAISSSKVLRWVGDAAAAPSPDTTGKTADDQGHEEGDDYSADEVLDHEGTSLKSGSLAGR
jgi:hypothetical protein